jgi:hypothetical protein
MILREIVIPNPDVTRSSPPKIKSRPVGPLTNPLA